MKKNRLLSSVIFLTSLCALNSAFANELACEKMFPNSLQTVKIPQCSLSHLSQSRERSETNSPNADNIFFAKTINNNNLGGLKINFKKGPKIVYRSAFLASSPLCIQQITNHVSTVVNLYSQNSGYSKELRALERAIFKRNGLTDYHWIQGFQFNADTSQEQLNKKLTEILSTIEKAPKNVLIHCYEGEHNTGIIFALLNKCYNKQPAKLIDDNLRCHMDTSTAYGKKALARTQNIINQYPCPN